MKLPLRRPHGSDPLADSASTAERLAVLLSAGVSPASAWDYLMPEGRARGAGPGSLGDRLRPVAAAARSGQDVVGAILDTAPAGPDGDGWRAVAAAWAVSTESGAPLAPALRSFAGALRSMAQSRREVETALAGPLITSRIVLALPPASVGLGTVLGFDVVGVLFGSAAGVACLVVGGLLAALAVVWMRRLVRSARRGDAAPGLVPELVAIAMGGGASAERAGALVDRVLERVGLSGAGADEVAAVLAVSRRAGVPASELLRSEAESARRRERAAGGTRAARLGSLLMIPLGVCVLPAFLVLGIAPMVLSLLSSTGFGR